MINSGRRGARGTLGDLIGLPRDRESRIAMFAMMGLYFLVVLSVGILRPVRNALALDGLAEGDFYQVYLVSALVILFVPVVNRLSNRFPWRRLIPAVALFFALNLVALRAVYVEGSTVFGLVFYGWYDLFAASLVTQFFMVTQLFFHARLAKAAYPVIIAGGSLGATLGGGITAFFAARLGTPNLLLLAAVPILVLSLVVPVVFARAGRDAGEPVIRRKRSDDREDRGRLRTIAKDRQVQLIAGMVLITILVKQIVDYQFNTITKAVYVDRDSVTAIQGWFNLATQWLPLVALAGMKPILRRWGVGLVVLILPVAMLTANVGLLLFWGLWAAFAAKGAETSLRYSVERAGREILYVPVPDEIKLKAKNYIDAALEKGVGKISSALILFIVIGLVGLEFRQVAWVGMVLSGIWILMALRVRKEYVQSLSRSVENRFASLRGAFASLADPATLEVVRSSMKGDERSVAFALDLLDESGSSELRPLAADLTALLGHPLPEIRRRSLGLLGRVPEAGDPGAIRERLLDPEPSVREAAVQALHGRDEEDPEGFVRELLGSERPEVRAAALVCLARGDLDGKGPLPRAELLRSAGLADGRTHGLGVATAGFQTRTPDERIERALVASALRPPGAVEILDDLARDPDPRVAGEALRSAGLLGDPELHPRLVAGLERRETREAARDALASLGPEGVPVLARSLLDVKEPLAVRRQIPSVLSRIPSSDTVPALVRCILAPETDQVLDYRAVKALSKLRARNPDLAFDPGEVARLMEHSLGACLRYAAAREALARFADGAPDDPPEPPLPVRLLDQAVTEAWAERREEVFRSLGLRYPPDDVHRCYMALVRGEQVPRSNALEWLESTVGYRLFRRLEPVLGQGPGDPGSATTSAGGEPRDALLSALDELEADQDHWIAHLALETRKALGLPASAAPGSVAPDSFGPVSFDPDSFDPDSFDPDSFDPDSFDPDSFDPDSFDPDSFDPPPSGSSTMNLVETVFLLQQIDILRDARSDHLALLATIAEEMDVDEGAELLREGEPGDALFVVVRGAVALTGAGGDLTLTGGRAFGTWALIDEVPSVVGATALEATRLLRIGREEYHDLLRDHPELAIGMLQGLARRIRTLVA